MLVLNAVEFSQSWSRKKNCFSGELNEASPKKLAFSFLRPNVCAVSILTDILLPR